MFDKEFIMNENINKIITNVSLNNDITLVTVYNLPNDLSAIAQLFKQLADNSVNVDMISLNPSQSLSQTVSFSSGGEDLPVVLSTIGSIKANFPQIRTDINSGNCKITFEGEAMKDKCGVAANIFGIIAEHGISIKLITTSETKISCLTDETEYSKTADMIENVLNIEN